MFSSWVTETVSDKQLAQGLPGSAPQMWPRGHYCHLRWLSP